MNPAWLTDLILRIVIKKETMMNTQLFLSLLSCSFPHTSNKEPKNEIKLFPVKFPSRWINAASQNTEINVSINFNINTHTL